MGEVLSPVIQGAVHAVTLLPASAQIVEVLLFIFGFAGLWRVVFLVQIARAEQWHQRRSRINGINRAIVDERLRKAWERFFVVAALAVFGLTRCVSLPISSESPWWFWLEWGIPGMFLVVLIWMLRAVTIEVANIPIINAYLDDVQRQRLEADRKAQVASEVTQTLRQGLATAIQSGEIPVYPPAQHGEAR